MQTVNHPNRYKFETKEEYKPNKPLNQEPSIKHSTKARSEASSTQQPRPDRTSRTQAVGEVSQYKSDSSTDHLTATKRIMRNLKRTAASELKFGQVPNTTCQRRQRYTRWGDPTWKINYTDTYFCSGEE